MDKKKVWETPQLNSSDIKSDTQTGSFNYLTNGEDSWYYS